MEHPSINLYVNSHVLEELHSILMYSPLNLRAAVYGLRNLFVVKQ